MKDKLTYFASRFSMFGIGFFLLFKYNGKDAWISSILGTILGVIVLFTYKYIKDYFKDKNIRDTLNKTIFGKCYLIIFLIFYLYLIIIIVILLPMFVNAFYLLYTPKLIVIIPFLLLAIYLSFKEKYVIESLSHFLFFISLAIIIIYALFLSKYMDVNNIFPVFSTKNLSIIKCAFIYASITSIPQIMTIHYSNNDFKDDLKNYLIASFTIISVFLYTILSLGEPLIKIYSFPEYAVLKQIKILKFIENIENLSTFLWYFDMFIALSTLTTNVKEILPQKYNKIYFFLSMIFVLFVGGIFIGSNYRIILSLFYTYPYILFIFFLLFTILLLYIKKSKKLK